MSAVMMEQEDFVGQKDAEIAALREDLQHARATIARLEGEIEELYRAAQAATKDNLEMRKRLQAIADEADANIQLAALRRAELEALEL
jgi:predicted RNase H-like nuclease (RuvC/YqgF family)